MCNRIYICSQHTVYISLVYNLTSSKIPSSSLFRASDGSFTWSRISVVRFAFSSDGKASSIFCITLVWCRKTIVESTWVIWVSYLPKPCATRFFNTVFSIHSTVPLAASYVNIPPLWLSRPSMIRQATRQPNLCWDSSITWSKSNFIGER